MITFQGIAIIVAVGSQSRFGGEVEPQKLAVLLPRREQSRLVVLLLAVPSVVPLER
jgi:hypothetical protein